MRLSANLGAATSLCPVYHPRNRCFKTQHPCVRLLTTTPRDIKLHAQGNFGTQLIGGGLGGGNEIFVAGADGQLGARIVQKLLQAGFKVAAGVNDEDQAQNVVDFATSVELLKKQEAQKLRLAELDLSSVESIQDVLPNRARVLVIVSDSSVKGSGKIDGRATSRILQAAQENDAQQFVLVTPAGSAGGGNFFTALFGSPSVGGSGKKPSKVEQEIASSGLDFVVIRTGKTDVQSSDFDETNNVALGQQGSLPAKPVISKAQLADVVQQILRQADSDVLIEAWASPQEPAGDIQDLVAQALPAATIEEEEEEEEESPVQAAQEIAEEAEVPEDVKKPARSLFGAFGTRKIKAKPSEEEAEDEEESSPVPTPKKRPAATRRTPAASRSKDDNGATSSTQRIGLFGLGKKKPQEEEEEDEEDSPPAKAKRGILGFGRKVQEEVEEEAPSKTKTQKGFLGLGKKIEEPEEEEVEEKSNPLKSLFGSGKKAEVSPEDARSSAVRGAKVAGRAAKKAPVAAARKTRQAAQDKDEAPKKKGFLASIGLDTDSYSYEEDGGA